MSMNRRAFLTFLSRSFIAGSLLPFLPSGRSEARIPPPPRAGQPEPLDPIIEEGRIIPDCEMRSKPTPPLSSNSGKKEAYLITKDRKKYPLLITDLSISRDCDLVEMYTPTQKRVLAGPEQYAVSLRSLCYQESKGLTDYLGAIPAYEEVYFYCHVNGFRIRSSCVVTGAELWNGVSEIPSISLELSFVGEPEELDFSQWPEWI